MVTQIVIQITMPVMRYEKFSKDSGDPVRTIQMKVQNGKLQIMNKDTKGERPYINMVALAIKCVKEAGYNAVLSDVIIST